MNYFKHYFNNKITKLRKEVDLVLFDKAVGVRAFSNCSMFATENNEIRMKRGHD